MGKVGIKNERFSKYLKYKLDKENIEVDDLYNIIEMTLNKNDEKDQVTDFQIDGIKYFKNLEELYIKNFSITASNAREICKLKNLRKIVFFNCDFQKNINFSKIIDKVEILNCNNTNNIKKISAEYIKISNTEIDFKYTKLLNNAKKIMILNCFLDFNIGVNKNKKIIINFAKTKDLYIINSKINNILFKFKKLEVFKNISNEIESEVIEYITKNDKKRNIKLIDTEEYVEFVKRENGDMNV